MIALHAALLARKVGKAVRMIYDRHEDLSATTKRHPAVIHHRTGVMRDGRLVAQEIDVVMDGGAYCTLTPGRAVPRRAARRWPVSVPERAHQGSGRWPPTRRPTVRFVASAPRRPSSRPRCRSIASPRRWTSARSSCAACGRTARATPPRPARSCARAWQRRRARGSGRGQRLRAAQRADPSRAGGSPVRRAPRVRDRDGDGLARRGLHRLGRGAHRGDRLGRADR